jgi:hypothetical protein
LSYKYKTLKIQSYPTVTWTICLMVIQIRLWLIAFNLCWHSLEIKHNKYNKWSKTSKVWPTVYSRYSLSSRHFLCVNIKYSITHYLVFWTQNSEVYPIQHYVIKFVNDLRQVGGFLDILLYLFNTCIYVYLLNNSIFAWPNSEIPE